MGLVMDEKTGKYAVLTDIAGAEDHDGDMDVKVAGTADGITALQMDIKVSGITAEIMTKALDQARRGRLYILDKMKEALTAPRQSMSLFAPRIVTIRILVERDTLTLTHTVIEEGDTDNGRSFGSALMSVKVLARSKPRRRRGFCSWRRSSRSRISSRESVARRAGAACSDAAFF